MSPPDDAIPDTVLDVLPHSFAGEPGAVACVEAWAAQHPRHRELLAGARRLWDAAGEPEHGVGRTADEAWAQFERRVNRPAADAPSAEHSHDEDPRGA